MDLSRAREARGTVKWYNAEKGFGFVASDDGGKDLFVHRSALERSGARDLPEGMRVGIRLRPWRRLTIKLCRLAQDGSSFSRDGWTGRRLIALPHNDLPIRLSSRILRRPIFSTAATSKAWEHDAIGQASVVEAGAEGEGAIAGGVGGLCPGALQALGAARWRSRSSRCALDREGAS